VSPLRPAHGAAAKPGVPAFARPRALAAVLLAVAAWLLAFAAPSPAAAAPPRISAPSAIVVEISTGDVAYARRPDDPRPIASVTKLMTALLTLEGRELSAKVRATRYAAASVESQLGLRPGERLTVADMLRGLLLVSANDVAASLAEDVAGSRGAFVRQMNRRAAALGLRRTRFEDPIGLGEDDRSTARELVTLTLALRRFPFFKRTVDRAGLTLKSGDHPRAIVNRNSLVRQFRQVSGVKTGHTSKAGYVLVGSARRRGITLVSVVLGAPSEAARNADTMALLRYGFSKFSRRLAVRRGTVLDSVPIRYRRGAELDLVAARSVRRVVRRGVRPVVKAVSVPEEVEGPIRRGQKLGRADVLVRGRKVESVALLAAASVPEAGVTAQAKNWITKPLGFVGVLLLVTGTVGLVLRRRGAGGDRAAKKSGRGVEAA
jgi:D-alanyl-D-alanine carboxypeptidase (penicillin-binding protein 5/6)